MKFFKSFDEFNNWNYGDCQGKLVDVFTGSGNNFVVLDRISGSLYCNPKYFETDMDAKIYAKDNFILQRVVIMLFDMEQYIASYKHLIGCVVSYDGSILMVVDCWNLGIHVEGIGDVHIKNPYFKALRFYLDDGTHVNDSQTLGTYKEYMQLHYPEYEHIWKHQL